MNLLDPDTQERLTDELDDELADAQAAYLLANDQFHSAMMRGGTDEIMATRAWSNHCKRELHKLEGQF